MPASEGRSGASLNGAGGTPDAWDNEPATTVEPYERSGAERASYPRGDSIPAAGWAYEPNEPTRPLHGRGPGPSPTVSGVPLWPRSGEPPEPAWDGRWYARPRVWVAALAAIAVVLIGGALVMAAGSALETNTAAVVQPTPTATHASVVAAAGGLAPAPTVTHGDIATPDSDAGSVRAGSLRITPGEISVPCPGTPVSLQLTNTGDDPVLWRAGSSFSGLTISPFAGLIAPNHSATVTVKAQRPLHGDGTIQFSATGGTAKIQYSNGCD